MFANFGDWQTQEFSLADCKWVFVIGLQAQDLFCDRSCSAVLLCMIKLDRKLALCKSRRLVQLQLQSPNMRREKGGKYVRISILVKRKPGLSEVAFHFH